MAEGFFQDDTIHIELGQHVFATPGAGRRNVMLDPHDAGAALLSSGGGVLDMTLTGQRARANLGDAERYIYERLYSLATSDPGTLGFEDNRGHRCTFSDAVITGASGEVHGLSFAAIEMDWIAPETSGEPAWAGVPSAPATYPGTSTAQDYQAGGVSMGVGGLMRMAMSRQASLRDIPRCRGARASVPHRGAHLRFIVTASFVADSNNLADDLRDRVRQIGPGPVDLTGNGNTFSGVFLQTVRPRHTDVKHTMVEWEFLKEV